MLQSQQGGVDVDLGCGSALVEEPPVEQGRPVPPPPREPDDACPSSVPPAGFTDTATSTHRAAIDGAVWWDVARGRGDGTFGPAAAVTRGHMATFVARAIRASGGQLPAGGDFFTDDDGNVHEDAIEAVAGVGITGGTGGTASSPARDTDRGQTASFLVRVLDLLVERGVTSAPKAR